MTTFLLTNDDGIDAAGIQALEAALLPFGTVVTVAPATVQSGISHRVSIWEDVQVDALSDNRFRVHGTPADCTRIGLSMICPEADWVFSGINIGANLGYDIYLSGTVAAAREAAFQGRPAVALSQYIGRNWTPDWHAATRCIRTRLPEILDTPLETGEFLNLNLPRIADTDPEIRASIPERTPYDRCVKRKDGIFGYEADIHTRPAPEGTDVAVCFGGAISKSLLSI